MSLGNKIKVLRESAGSSQTDLARRIGKRPHYVCQIERGIFKPSLKTLERIAAELGTKTSILLDENIPPTLARPLTSERKEYVNKLLTILNGKNNEFKLIIRSVINILFKKQSEHALKKKAF